MMNISPKGTFALFAVTLASTLSAIGSATAAFSAPSTATDYPGGSIAINSIRVTDSSENGEDSLCKVNLIREIFEAASVDASRQICDKGTGKCK